MAVRKNKNGKIINDSQMFYLSIVLMLLSCFFIENFRFLGVVLFLSGFLLLINICYKKIKIIYYERKKLNNNKNDLMDDDHLNNSMDNYYKNDLMDNKKIVITSLDELEKTFPMPSYENIKEIEEEIIEPSYYKKPSIKLLDPVIRNNQGNTTELINNNISILDSVFNDFGINAKVVEVHEGPVITQYEMNLQRGTKVDKVFNISREIALALAAKEVRIEAPIPGKNTIGVEMLNKNIKVVSMRETMIDMNKNTKLANSKLAVPLGRDIAGNTKYIDINKYQNILVAGAPGTGKSNFLHSIILSILMRTTPDEVKMVLVDPKKVEFNIYDGIPHLLTPIVTDPKKASEALQRIIVMIDDRYETFKNSGTKNIQTYNEYVKNELKKHPDCGLRKMPFVLVIIDELADLMLVAAKEVEESIIRITQLARAAGVNMIISTVDFSEKTITDEIKQSIPCRISFDVATSNDSITILDMTGAEKLLGKGEMLFKQKNSDLPIRIQGSFVSDSEIARIVDFIKKNSSTVRYSKEFNNIKAKSDSSSAGGRGDDGGKKDVLYDEVLEYAIRTGQISASLIQRKFSLSYNRAVRIIDQFEERGLVSPAKGSKPRDVLVTRDEDD